MTPEQEKKLNEVHSAIVGEPSLGIKGIIPRINELEDYKTKDEKFKKLVESIKGFPEMLKLRPIVVNDQMVVLGGNMRLKACKEAGLKEVEIIKASDLTEEQQPIYINELAKRKQEIKSGKS